MCLNSMWSLSIEFRRLCCVAVRVVVVRISLGNEYCRFVGVNNVNGEGGIG